MHNVNSGELWCLSHDCHGDGRIWSFMEAFNQAGLDVHAIHPYLEFRPLPQGVTPVFPKGRKDQAVPAILTDAKTLFLLRNIIAKFESSDQPSSVALEHDGWVYYGPSILTLDDTSSWALRDLKGRNVYLGRNGDILSLSLPGRPLLDKALLSCLATEQGNAKTLFEARFEQLKADLPNVNIQAFTDNKVRIRGYDFPEHISLYVLDMMSLEYEIIDSPVLPSTEIHDFFGLKIDYRDLRKHVYDYSDMMNHVLEYIKRRANNSEGFKAPEFIYVADLPILPVAVMMKRRFGCKIIVDCHEWWAEQHLIWNPDEKERSVRINELEGILYRECAHCVTVGHNLANRMSQEFDCKFEGIYTVCSPPTIDTQVDLRAQLGVPDDTALALFQGSLTSNRNIESLMQATSKLKDNQHLVVLGDGFFAQTLREVLTKHGAPEKCSFLGHVDNTLMQAYTQQCDVGIVPYKALNEYYASSMPNKFSEYYSSKIPMIVDPTMLEMADFTKRYDIGVLADCGNPIELGQALASLLCDKSRLDKIRNNYANKPNPFSQEALNVSVAQLISRMGNS